MRRAASTSSATWLVSIVSLPPSGMASRALIARLRIAFSTSPGLAKIWHGSGTISKRWSPAHQAFASAGPDPLPAGKEEQLAGEAGTHLDGIHCALDHRADFLVGAAKRDRIQVGGNGAVLHNQGARQRYRARSRHDLWHGTKVRGLRSRLTAPLARARPSICISPRPNPDRL